MAAVFTPGLQVTEKGVIQKDRRLPLEGEVTVSMGEMVTAETVVARTELPGKIYPINVANQLGVDAGRLKSLMTKTAGDKVTEGEIIATSPGFFGLFKSEATSIVTGTIESVSGVTGQVIFQADPVPVEMDAYINGRVVEVIPSEGCVIQSNATFIQGIFGLGGEARGEITMVAKAPSQIVTESDITEDCKGKVLVGGAYLSVSALKRAVEVGASAFVTGGFDYDEIKDLLGYEVGVAITGGEDLGLTLIVTEGFGEIQMAPATFKLLKAKAGMMASVNGATQIRAGVMRPEVVVTFDEASAPTEIVKPPEPVGIQIGDKVRGIRAPYFGLLGTLKSLPNEPTVLDSESKARVMEVTFEDGTEAIVPRANVEAIKG